MRSWQQLKLEGSVRSDRWSFGGFSTVSNLEFLYYSIIVEVFIPLHFISVLVNGEGLPFSKLLEPRSAVILHIVHRTCLS